MKVINARNVNEALKLGIQLIQTEGEFRPSRGGDTIEIPCPVATVYQKPWERVLISEQRDANPFFHLMEALWILAGREDVKFLTEFNKRMGEYSDDGVIFNAPYGYRLRNGNCNARLDQLSETIKILKENPDSRQAVMQIWDEDDLVHNTKDKACNMSVVFRIRNGNLDMTVYNRSNDMIWGAYGANVVQFSMLQEYVAAKIGNVGLGHYTQISNAFHVYTSGPGGEVWDRLKNNYHSYGEEYDDDVHQQIYMLPSDMDDFEHDLSMFFRAYDDHGDHGLREVSDMVCWKSQYFNRLVLPMLAVFLTHKQHGPRAALDYAHHIECDAWCIAAQQWLSNRVK